MDLIKDVKKHSKWLATTCCVFVFVLELIECIVVDFSEGDALYGYSVYISFYNYLRNGLRLF